MSKGDIFEPLFEVAFRIFVPRHGGSIADELSWSWLVPMLFTAVSYTTIKKYLQNAKAEQSETSFEVLLQRFRVSRYASWLLLFFSLEMFRFGSYF